MILLSQFSNWNMLCPCYDVYWYYLMNTGVDDQLLSWGRESYLHQLNLLRALNRTTLNRNCSKLPILTIVFVYIKIKKTFLPWNAHLWKMAFHIWSSNSPAIHISIILLYTYTTILWIVRLFSRHWPYLIFRHRLWCCFYNLGTILSLYYSDISRGMFIRTNAQKDESGNLDSGTVLRWPLLLGVY